VNNPVNNLAGLRFHDFLLEPDVSYRSVMVNLTNPKLIYLKGGLFLLCGLLACAGLLLESPHLKTVLLLALAIWCFCRFYYFAFYVIEHYVDARFKFAGLRAFAWYLISKKNSED
jgi:hypothetical protein